VKQNILVTGAAGYLGRFCVNIIDAGYPDARIHLFTANRTRTTCAPIGISSS
jgi:thioester reductase-like protein